MTASAGRIQTVQVDLCSVTGIGGRDAHLTSLVTRCDRLPPSSLSDFRLTPWLLGRFKRICVSVNSETELLALHEKAAVAGLITALIQDADLTEFGGVPTYTALAVGPDRADRVDAVTGELPLL